MKITKRQLGKIIVEMSYNSMSDAGKSLAQRAKRLFVKDYPEVEVGIDGRQGWITVNGKKAVNMSSASGRPMSLEDVVDKMKQSYLGHPLNEQTTIGDLISAVDGTPEVVIDVNMLEDFTTPSPSEILSAYISFLRAYHLWMHGAHNVSKGPSFAGDHVELYGKIYNEIQAVIDIVIEKGVGVYQDEDIACPMKITGDAMLMLDEWESPSGQNAERIATLALEYTKQLVNIGEGTARTLEDMEVLTYGMDNMLAGLVDTHENYVYLLQQRTK